MKPNRVLPGLGLGIAILVLGPLRTQYRFEYQAAGLLGLALLSAIWLAMASRRGGRVSASALDVPLTALVMAFTIASALSLDPRRSLGQVQLLLAHVLLFWIVFDLLSRDEPQASSLKPQAALSIQKDAGSSKLGAWVFGLLAVTGVVLLLAVAEVESWYLSWWSLGGAAHPLPPFSYRLTSWLGHASGFSALIAACAPLAVAVMLHSRRPCPRILTGLWMMGALTGLVFASSRSGWLAFGAGLAAFAVVWTVVRRRTGVEGRQVNNTGQPTKWLSGPGTAHKGPERARGRGAQALVVLGLGLAVGLGWLAYRQFQDPTHTTLALSRAELWPPAWNAFLSSPVVGTGPATFYRHFLEVNPLSLHTFLTQAHSVIVSLLAEEGLLGAASAAFIVIVGLLRAVGALRESLPNERPWRIGAAGGLAALGVHAFADNAATTPPVSLVLIVLAALLLGEPPLARPTLPRWIPSLVLLLSLGYGALTLPGQLEFQRGLGLAGRDRPAAAAALAAAARADPKFGWYSLQAGFAYALAAQEDRSYLEEARIRLETGIRLEPAYSLHRLNLAWVYWELGDRAAALISIERAAAIDPTSPLILLNQGWMLEATGNPRSAASAYHAALDSDAMQAELGYAAPHGSLPHLADSLFWDSNEFRRQVREQWSVTIGPTAYAAAIEGGFRQLEAGNAPAAHQHWQEARRVDPFRPEAYRGLALTAALEGKTDEARYFLQVAGNARGSAYERLLAWLDLMELEARAGQPSRAIEAGRRGFELLESYNSWGMGSDHANPYAWGVFYRESLPDDLLPWVLRPDMSADLANRFLDLAQLLDLGGNRPDACRVTHRVLHAAPEFDPALAASELYACGS